MFCWFWEWKHCYCRRKKGEQVVVWIFFPHSSDVVADVQGECLGIVKLHASPCYGMASKDGSYFSWSSDSSIR